MNNQLTVIKIGTNVITNKKGKLDLKIIRNLIYQIGKLHKKGENIIIISSGAVGAGKEICSDHNLIKSPSIKKRMLAAIGQVHLIDLYTEYFNEEEITIGQVLVERRNLSERRAYVDFRDTLEELITRRYVPILNENDVTTPQEWQFGENDHLATIVAIALKANKLILCTDVDGLYTDDPRLNKRAKMISEVKSITKKMQLMAKKSSSGIGLGGMMSKIQAVKLATQAGIESFIINGKKTNNILKIYKNTEGGTKFLPQERNLKNFQRWLAAGAHTDGQIIIDEGAEKALKKRKSLLVVGIRDIAGSFNKGDIVDILNLNKSIIGVGMINYSKRQIKLHLNKNTKTKLKEVIHCDNLVLV